MFPGLGSGLGAPLGVVRRWPAAPAGEGARGRRSLEQALAEGSLARGWGAPVPKHPGVDTPQPARRRAGSLRPWGFTCLMGSGTACWSPSPTSLMARSMAKIWKQIWGAGSERREPPLSISRSTPRLLVISKATLSPPTYFRHSYYPKEAIPNSEEMTQGTWALGVLKG